MTIADYTTYLVTDQARNLKSSRGKNHFFLGGGGAGGGAYFGQNRREIRFFAIFSSLVAH